MISPVRVVRRAAGQILRAAPLHVAPLVLWRKLLPKRDLGVCYHMVSDGPVRHLKHYRVLDTDTFESDLDYLEGRFEFVTYEELAFRADRAAFRRYLAKARKLDPNLAPAYPAVISAISRLIGYEAAETVADLARLPKNVLRKFRQGLRLGIAANE